MAGRSNTGDFVHLHVHSEFSMLDGAARIPDIFTVAEEMEMPAVAMTDHGYLFGAYEFYKVSKNFPVKPIIGLEAYVTPKTDRGERKRVRWGDGGGDDVSGSGAYTHMTMLAETTEGMHNLFRLGSRASLEGFFYKPRMDRELLNEYGKGLIATTGCPSGEVQTYLRLGQYDNARASAAEFRDIFGADNYYVELMDHGLSIENRVRDDLLKISKDLNLPLVATNDLHYVREQDAAAHEVLLCIQSGSRMDDPKRFRFSGSGYYLKSAAEMRKLFADLPEACDNTLAIAERCNIDFTESEGRFMPKFPCPPGEDETSWFIKEVEKGLHERFPEGISDEVRKRVEFEQEVIIGKGYPGYFLVVADFINWAKENGIRVGPGRGSGAGSMCAYAMRITDLDPIKHTLLFERFLNPERASMPDFDIDFDERRRGEVIKYVTDKYGDDRVCQIATYGTIKAKQAIKDSARVMGYPFSVGDQITKKMPPAVMGKDVPLAEIHNTAHKRYAEGGEFRDLLQNDPEAKAIFDKGVGIEGLKRQWGVHAAGVIMSSEPLQSVIPIMKREQDGAIITQFDYPACEALGLVKMDFLGLRNLTILDDAVKNVKRNRNIDLDLDEIGKHTDDKATYELLCRADTLGVFQLDGSGMRQLLRLMQPDNFEDISAALALYRPGPMGVNAHTNFALRKNGKQALVPLDPQLEGKLQQEMIDALDPILGTTYFLVIYQEQVMEIAQKLAGYTLGNADLLRRAMGKKKKEVLDKEYIPFSEGMRAKGFNDDSIAALWGVLVPFSDYAFNKSHTAAYGLVAYWTAYLKANYPAEYMAALLTSVKDDKDKMAIYLGECRRMGIKVLPPDVNESEADFTPVGTDIRFGLTAVRNVGANVVDAIVAARTEHGPAKNFTEFLDQIPLAACNKRVVESLIKAGGFDEMNHPRRALMTIHEQAIDSVIDLKRNEANGQDDLFAGFGGDDDDAGGAGAGFTTEIPDLADWDKKTKLALEREMLGLYVSDHPLQGLEHVLEAERDISIVSLMAEDGPREGQYAICGMITQVTRKQTKNGDYWAIITVEDLEASIDVLLFPKVYTLVSTMLATDTIVRVRGRMNAKEDRIEMHGQEVTLPDVTEGPHGPVVISIRTTRVTPPVVEQLKGILTAHPGVTEVRLRLTSQEQRTLTYRLGQQLRVTPSPPLMADLKALLGPSCLAG